MVDVAGTADAFAGLADALLRDMGPVDFLQYLSRGCAQLVPGRATAVLLTRDYLDSDGASGALLSSAQTGAQSSSWLQVCATSSAVAAQFASLESRAGQGPCWQAMATRQSVLDVDLRTRHQQWPDLVSLALAAGTRTVSALPLHRDGAVAIGVLVIYHGPREVASVSSAASSRRMADVATAGLLTRRFSVERELLARQLHSTRRSRVLIEQATGVLASHAGVSLSEAAAQLRQQARWAEVTLTAIAAAITDIAVSRPGEPAGSPSLRRTRSDLALAGTACDGGHEDGADRASCNEVDLLILRLFWTEVSTSIIASTFGWSLSQLAQRMVGIRAQLEVTSTAAAVDAAHRLNLL